jgi:hypothetical protein
MPELTELFDFPAYIPYTCAEQINHIQQTLAICRGYILEKSHRWCNMMCTVKLTGKVGLGEPKTH